MRKVILYIAMSLDGYIARRDGDLSWLLTFQSTGEDYGYNEFIDTVDTVIMGRKTYDTVASLGYEYPHPDKQCFIITRSSRPPKKHIVFFHQDLVGLVKNLRREMGKNIYVDGGAGIVNTLMMHRLIDEYIISIIPTMLGEGIRLAIDGRPEEKLVLKQCSRYDSGLVQLHYIHALS